MGLELSALKGKVRTVNVTYLDDNFTVTYRPSEMTAEAQAADKERLANGEDHVLADGLTRLITAWDLVEEGKPYPVTQENMRALPNPLLAAINLAVTEDVTPKPKNAGRSFSR